MRIAELSRDSGVSVPTIKYYVREGLLKPGQLTSPNQAQYDDSHLRRLRLIRALTEVGGLSVAAVRELLAAASGPATSLHDALGKVQYATTPGHQHEAAQEAAHQQVDDFVRRHGWQVRPDSPARRALASVLTALHDLGQDDLGHLADAYAGPAEQIAAADVAAILARQGRDSQLQGVVIGTVLGDAMLSALRLLAQENASARAARLPATAPSSRHARRYARHPAPGISFVDVRDVAAAHVAAMTAAPAGGQRYLTTGTFLWLADLAAILRRTWETPRQRCHGGGHPSAGRAHRRVRIHDRPAGVRKGATRKLIGRPLYDGPAGQPQTTGLSPNYRVNTDTP